MLEQQVNQLVGHLFRYEAGKMAAVLTRLLGFQALDLAEDIVQDTLLKAMTTWRYKGIPENPSAWLYTVAKRKAIDAIRKQRLHDQIESEISYALRSEWTLSPTVSSFFLDNEIEDSQLRMIFACCHPTIPYESQIALTLKTLCGLSIAEIANSFITNEETIVKRLYRAREKIREEKISLATPVPATIPGRMDAVLHTLYLLFSEGYNSSHPDQLIRHELCEEAMRLCHLIVNNPITTAPRARALLALMCFQASREEARLAEDGTVILLQDQDRTKWSQPLIEKGKLFLEQSAEGQEFTEYHIEAAIAGCHSASPSFRETKWNNIIELYTFLLRFKPGPIVELNKAIAIGYGHSPLAGLKALQEITGLEGHYLYYAAIGDFYSELGDEENARLNYDKATMLTTSNTEKKLLRTKLSRLAIKS
ncbi:MAG TPA: sigma-70 family RNA polymerase sigma factor [Chryseolinea sp.]|nr:sigma-70 family RNA polymerase sigma factor [Chryseolinea sp.]